MKNRVSLPTLALSASVLALVAFSGCSKKEEAAAPAEPGTPAATAPAAQTPAAATPAAATAPDAMKELAVSASKTTEKAATDMKKAAAEATPPTAELKATAEIQQAAGATADSAVATVSEQAATIQKQAEELLTRYSGEIETLKSGALAVKSYIDKHPDILPAGYKEKYAELNALVPQLDSLVGSLKNYKGTDLASLATKLKADYSKAQSLFSEIRGLLPADFAK